jgi:hypothetical protein
MSRSFFDSAVCRSRGHCPTCQDETEAGRGFRLSQLAIGLTGLPANGDKPECPFGMNPPPIDGMTDDERELMRAASNPEGWGDDVAALIHNMGADRAYKLVRKTLGLVESCSGCNGRRMALNRLEGWVKGVFGVTPGPPASPPRP